MAGQGVSRGAPGELLARALSQANAVRTTLKDAVFHERPPDLGGDQDAVRTQQMELAGRTLHVLRLPVVTFTSRGGRPRRHSVVIVAPEPDVLASTSVAVVSANAGTREAIGSDADDPTWGRDHPPWFAGTDTAEADVRSFASIATAHGVPDVAGDPGEVALRGVRPRGWLDARQPAEELRRQPRIGPSRRRLAAKSLLKSTGSRSRRMSSRLQGMACSPLVLFRSCAGALVPRDGMPHNRW